MKKEKKKTKNLMVSFCTLVFALFLVASVSAFTQVSANTTTDLVNTYDVTVEGIDAYANTASVIAGETVTVKVYFDTLVDDTDVTVEVEIEGSKVDTRTISEVFDVETGKSYRKVLSIKVPFELKDEVSDEVTLSIEIDGKDYKTNLADTTLRVQRPSYNPVIKSITVPSSIEAGETFPIEIVLKNMGYNELDDVFVTAKIIGLGVSQGPKWFGDIVTLDNHSYHHDHEDTVVGNLYLEVPYPVKEGIYTLEVTVDNDDVRTTEVRQIVIENDFENNVLVTSSTERNVAQGQEAVYEFLIVNPTNNVKIYKIVSESTNDVSSTPSQTIIAVPAGSSKTVKVVATSNEEGLHNFNVNIFSNEELVNTVTFSMDVEESQDNPIVILTIALAIIFLVLLVILIVVLGKKPEKTEDFGESYY